MNLPKNVNENGTYDDFIEDIQKAISDLKNQRNNDDFEKSINLHFEQLLEKFQKSSSEEVKIFTKKIEDQYEIHNKKIQETVEKSLIGSQNLNLDTQLNEWMYEIPSPITLICLMILFLFFMIQSQQLTKVLKMIMDESEVVDEQILKIKSQIEYMFRSRKYLWPRKTKLPKYRKKKNNKGRKRKRRRRRKRSRGNARNIQKVIQFTRRKDLKSKYEADDGRKLKDFSNSLIQSSSEEYGAISPRSQDALDKAISNRNYKLTIKKNRKKPGNSGKLKRSRMNEKNKKLKNPPCHKSEQSEQRVT
jgi:hypothetical protein